MSEKRPLYAWGPRAIVIVAILGSVVSASAQTPRIRDSAGARIIELPLRETIPIAFRPGIRPVFEVGGTELNPEQEFNHLQGYLRGVRLSNGGLAVIDVTRVHFFDARGTRIRIVGREGSGPQEFLYLTAICRTRGDTIVVGDNRNRRLSVIAPDGPIVRTIAQGNNGGPQVEGFCFSDGAVAVMRPIGELRAGARTQRITKVQINGTVERVIGDFDGRLFDIVSQTSVGIAAHGRTLFFGDPAAGEVRQYTDAGKLLRIFRLTEPRQRITEAEVEERLARMNPSNMTDAARKEQIARFRALPRSDTWPLYYRFFVSSEGILWFHDFRRDYRAATIWSGFDSAGRAVGRLELPAPRGPAAEVHGFGADYIMMRRFDADMAAYLSTYPLMRVDGRRR